MDQIATQLGVSHPTIVRDLKEFVHDEQTQSRTSKRGRKGEGRPKGGGRKSTRGRETPKLDKAREIVRSKLEADKPISPHKLQDEHGISHVTFDMAITAELARKQALAEPQIDRSDLSLTAQQKFEGAIKQEKRRLAASFHQAVNDKVREFLEATILPDWKQKIDQAHKLYDKRRALMDKETFNIIRRALHPDSRNSISDRKLGEAFDAFMALEKYLLDEKDSPTPFGETLPRTWADWEEAKRKATEERKAKYAASRSVIRPR